MKRSEFVKKLQELANDEYERSGNFGPAPDVRSLLAKVEWLGMKPPAHVKEVIEYVDPPQIVDGKLVSGIILKKVLNEWEEE